ncbi:GNAT family N-acetyltransferase [Flavobacterium sp. LMO8]|uniref:GNAT family N-acetyltransferase n=1 Tax=Flavobacterium sp. LMO8 TaxID=2654244 RepID=UPI001291EB12|nr:GNAT family N-acetyltransferase [Flavobacterium sp. LMO8]MQP25419.1 GNAT family N-acetyltransferase [Flavobacterium sp. LMO8]
MEIKKINSIDTYPVRHEVLRKGKPIESCQFKGDDDENTVHFGLFLEDKLVGIISIFKEKNELFSEINQFQIRGMAVLEEFQGKGFGAELVKETENYCVNLKTDLIWFNARENAVPFYKKLGYTTIGDSFLIPDVGIHFAMYKKIL